MRSLLFVPADSPRKIEKALTSGADAIILDLEDSVAPAAKDAARQTAARCLADQRAPAQSTARPDARRSGPLILVRVNALDNPCCDADLDAVVQHAPFAIMLPKSSGGEDIQHLSAKLAVREAEAGLDEGAIRILPIVTETAHSVLKLASYRGASRRLFAMTWGAEDLAADMGALANRDDAGAFTPPFALARNLMLMAAASAGADAIDTVFTAFSNTTGLRLECESARRDGFTGKMAIHPAQIVIINDVFTPPAHQLARAQKIVEAFAQHPESGVLAIDGEMIDLPHLRMARRLLLRAAQTSQS